MLLLLPDLGTAPVTRYREMFRRVLIQIHSEHELLVATPDPEDRGMRTAAWRALIARVARRDEAELPRVRVVNWSEVCARLGGSVTHPLVWAQWRRTARTESGTSGRNELLHLLGRHPLLTVAPLAHLLGIPRARIERLERELTERGWLRALEGTDLSASGLDLKLSEFARLGLVEVTSIGRRRLADVLGLDAPTASRYHGLTASGRGATRRRRRLLRTLEHTPGTNDVFVAFASAAAEARRSGGKDELSEWRSAAACERRDCKADGYGLYTRNSLGYGCLLEYDRGTRVVTKIRGEVPRVLPLPRQRASSAGL